MVTKTEIANRTFIAIGDARVSDVDTDTSDPALEFNAIYTGVRDTVLKAHTWNFATRTRGLAGSLLEVPDHDFARALLLPDGNGSETHILRAVRVGPADAPEAFAVEGEDLLTSAIGAPANMLFAPDDFSNTTYWTASNLTVTADQDTGPARSNPADLLDDSGSSRGVISQARTVPDGTGWYLYAVKVKETTAAYATLQAKLTGGTSEITVYAELKFSDDTVVKGGAQSARLHSYGRRQLTDGYVLLWLVVQNNGTGNTTLTLEIYPTGLTAEAAADTGALYAVTGFAEPVTPAEVQVIEAVTDVTKFSPDFVTLLVAELAADLAFVRAKSNTLVTRLERRRDELRAQMRSIDGREGKRLTVVTDSFLNARY